MIQALIYGGLSAAALALGGVFAAYRPLSPRLRSHIQHAAAGFVFAAVGVEVLPDVLDRALPVAAALGFAAGVALMLAIRAVSEKLEAESGERRLTLIAVVGSDVFIDGLLVGVSTGAGASREALLITVAVAAELLSIGLSMTASLVAGGAARRRAAAIAFAVALSALLGTVAGYAVAGAMTGPWLEATLAFAAAALLYLAAEELLVEAHEVEETLLSTALFFAAFLALLIIGMVTK